MGRGNTVAAGISNRELKGVRSARGGCPSSGAGISNRELKDDVVVQYVQTTQAASQIEN